MMKPEQARDPNRMFSRILLFFSVFTAASLIGFQSQAIVVIYAQDFEDSPAADEYASGDFDPVPVVEGSEGVFYESAPVGVQVVDVDTIVNGSPEGEVAVMGNKALKISGGVEVPACCQHYHFHPTQVGGTGSSESIFTFSFYGVPSTDGNAGQRLVETWANEGADFGSTGGPNFIYELRFDENGSIFYDSQSPTGWVNSGLSFPLNQWNTISISSRVDGATRPFVTLTVNGTLHDNGGTGYGQSVGTPSTIDRYQITSSPSSGPGSGTFFDDFYIEDPLATEPPTNTYSVVQSEFAFFTLDGMAGQSYKVEFTTDPTAGDWTATGYTFEGKVGDTMVFDPTGGDGRRVYRIAVQ